MRITYLRLVNHVGVRAGTGRSDIDIDFGNEGSLFVMLAGRNGSGKTSVLSALHPFAGSQDARDRPVAAGEEGFKELHITDGEDEYVIKHFYGKKTTQSYLEKNGEELNENGGVKTFKDLVRTHLGVTEDYATIGRIGSNVTGFVDLTASQRKEYISDNFLPDIDDFLRAFDRTKTKYSELKGKVKQVGEQLQKLDEADVLIQLREANDMRIREAKKRRDDFLIGAQVARENAAREDRRAASMSGAAISAADATKEYKKAMDKVAEYLSIHPSLSDYSTEECSETLAGVKIELDIIERKRSGLVANLRNANERLAETTNLVAEKTAQLKRVGGTDESLPKMEKILSDLKNGRAEAIAEVKRVGKPTANLEGISIHDLKRFSSDMSKLREFILNDRVQYSDAHIEWAVDSAVAATLCKFDGEAICDKINEVAEGSKYWSNEAAEAKGRIKVLEAGLVHLETLKKRPGSCVINSCAFIAKALEQKDTPDKIKEAEAEREAALVEYREFVSWVETYESILSIWNRCDALAKVMTWNKDVLERTGLWEYASSASGICQMLGWSTNYVSDLLDVEAVVTRAIAQEAVRSFDERITILKERMDGVRKTEGMTEEIRSELKRAVEAVDKAQSLSTDAKKALDKLDDEAAIPKARVEVLDGYLSYLVKIIESKDKLDSVSKQAEEHRKAIEESQNQTKIANGFDREALAAQPEIDRIERTLRDVDVKIAKREEYETSMAELDAKFAHYELIHKALHPAKGIPLLFIQSYLEKTREICNGLLDVAYNGAYRIDSFDLSEKEFLIKVATPAGELLDDVKYASQGEKALTSIAISMAMIEQAMSKFNIVYLDECDGPLDGPNREAFVEMIRQMAKKMGIEQVFIISHNGAFYHEKADMILLKGAEFDDTDDVMVDCKRIVFDGR
jgi:DNA repair exonuclease SbcCD ATPase subunit